MKRIFVITLALFLFIATLSAFAHPPTDIIFNYDAKGKILSVGVAHSVEDPNNHFIKEINIKVNGKDWISQNFLSQANLEGQAVSYAQVDLKKDDIIEVFVVCNKGGKLRKKFQIK